MRTTFRRKAGDAGRPAPGEIGEGLRVVHCIPTLSLGGAQRVMIEIIREMQSLGVSSKVVVLGGEETAVEWPSLPVVPHYLNYRGSLRDRRGRLRATGELVQLLRDDRAHILHSHLWGAATLAGRATARCGVAHFVHIHDTRPWVASGSLRDRFRRWQAKRDLSDSKTFFAAVSKDAWRYNSASLGLSACEHAVVPNGVNTNEFRPRAHVELARAAAGPLRVGVVARFNPEKGHEPLIRAVARLLKDGVHIELHLAGQGMLVDDCQRLAQELGIADSVMFAGMTTDVPSFLHSLDVFVLPSLACEGMPLSILEAMAVGLPVIATDVGGTSEVIVDGANGLLISPADVEAIATAVRRLCVDPQLRQRLSTNGLAHVRQEHSWQTVARTIEGHYQQLVGIER